VGPRFRKRGYAASSAGTIADSVGVGDMKLICRLLPLIILDVASQ
jgi:hypothetical protein